MLIWTMLLLIGVTYSMNEQRCRKFLSSILEPVSWLLNTGSKMQLENGYCVARPAHYIRSPVYYDSEGHEEGGETSFTRVKDALWGHCSSRT